MFQHATNRHIRPPPMSKKIVRAYVEESVHRAFREQFPGTGSVSWLLETAMQELLSLTRGQPSAKETVRSLIKSVVLSERISNRARANARPSKSDSTISVEPITATDPTSL